MTTAGDAAPDRSRSDWIVRLHRDNTSTSTEASELRADSSVVLAGDVVAHRGDAATNFGAVSIHRRASDEQLQLSADVLELRCESRDLPDSNNTPPATDLDHVVLILCSRFSEPEAIERFMAATRGMAASYMAGREAWLEVLAHPTDRDGGMSDTPIVDDVFLGRYPDLETWQALHDLEAWARPLEELEREASTIFHLVIAPTINRVALYR